MKRLLSSIGALFLTAAVLTANPAQAQAETTTAAAIDATLNPGVTRAGQEHLVSTAIRYGTSGRSWRTEIRQPGATYIKVHFSALKLVAGDYVTVSDPTGREVHAYYGDPTRTSTSGGSGHTRHGVPGFAALSIDGDTAIVTLHATSARSNASRLSRQGYGVVIDRYFRGLNSTEAAAANPALFSVCGTDARRDVVCYQTSHPTEYARGNAVARQLLNGLGHCTVWRVGNTNRMLTNNHCMESAADLQSSEFQFDYHCATCGGNNPRAGTKVSGAQFLKTSALAALDYTLFSVNNFASIQQFGTLYLDVREPVAGERIYIPGHGDTLPKRLSLYEDTQGGATCKIDVVSSGVNTGYRCDTSGGNSGSPVLAASSHKVIALHHLGGCPNWGTRITLVYNEISSMIDNNPPGNSDFAIAVSPTSGTTNPGGNVNATVSTATIAGSPQTVNLTAAGLPAGATAGFVPASVQSGASSTLTISTTAQTLAGTYAITVAGTGTSGTRTTSFTLTVASPTGNDFSIGASPGSGSTSPGGSVNSTVSTTVTSGSPQSVSLTASGLPTGATASFNPATIQSGGSSALTVSTTAQTPAGSYPITISGTGTAVTRTTTFTLTVNTTPGGCQGMQNTRTGTLSTGASQYQPDNSYYQSTVSGTHRGCLDGPTGTDFDLYLQKWNGSAWANVAQAAGAGPDETLTYNGTAGYYRYRVHAYSGSGAYTLGYNRP